MSQTTRPLSSTTIAFHWLIAVAIIGMLAFGIYIEDFIPGRLADGSRNPLRGDLMFYHKSLGALILVIAFFRVIWRIREGWPTPAGLYKRFEHIAAKITHWILAIGTILMPLSGIVMTQAAGRPVPVFGLFTFPTIVWESKTIGDIAHVMHGFGAYLLIAAICLHFIGALKHHFIDRDVTLRRMLGAQ